MAGNAAVGDLIAQRAPAPAVTPTPDAPTREQVPAEALPKPAKILPPPPPLKGIPTVGEGEGPHPGVDIAADASSITITFVYKDWNFPESEDDAVIDWMHEPNVSIQIVGGNASQPAIQAAISAINIHLRRHGKDLVELSAGPQVGVPTDDPRKTSIGAQAQAELHITATFSLTASSTVSGARNPDTGRVDITWQPISVGVLYHLPSGKKKEVPNRSETADDTIGWIESQFDASTLDDGAKAGNLKDGEDEIIRRLIVGMEEAAGADVARIDLDLGEHPQALPSRLGEGLTELVRLIKFSHPKLESMSHVQVSVWHHVSNDRKLMGFFDAKPGPQPGVPGDYEIPKGKRRRA